MLNRAAALTAKNGLAFALLLAACVYLASPAFSQGYPHKPVSIVAPVAAGTGADVIVRILADGWRSAGSNKF